MKAPSLRDFRDKIDASADMLTAVSPPALTEYLMAADRYVLDCLTAPYCAPAMCVDATSNGLTDARSGGAIFAPATNHARAWIVRTASLDPDGATQYRSEITNTTSGGGASDVIESAWQPFDPAGYLDVTADGIRDAHAKLTGDEIDDTPAAAMDRQLEIDEQLVAVVEDFVVSFVDGVTLWPSARTVDLETL